MTISPNSYVQSDREALPEDGEEGGGGGGDGPQVPLRRRIPQTILKRTK